MRSDDKFKISFLIDKLLTYARKNNFKIIRGPINIPTILFGWGFMKKGSLQTIYRGCPVNTSIYNSLFLKHRFKVKNTILTFEGFIPHIPQNLLAKYDYSKYQLNHVSEWNEILSFKDDFLRLNFENLSPEHSYTPNLLGILENYIRIEMRFGHPFMFTFIRHIPSNKVVGYLVCLPNPFRKNLKGEYDSFTLFSLIIEKDHQKKGLGFLLMKTSCDKGRSHNIIYTTGPLDSTNIKSIELCKKIGLTHKRTHLIYEYHF